MDLISIKEYARINNVSYEAVRRLIDRYQDELKGHIHKQGRTRFLDTEAVSFLDEKRKKNPVIIQEQNKDEELERIREENSNLKTMLLEAQKQIIDLQKEGVKMLEAKANYNALLLEKTKQEAELLEATKNLSEAKITLQEQEAELKDKEKKLQEAEAEANSYQKSFFGLYKKVK